MTKRGQQISRTTGLPSLKQRIREALRSIFTKYHQPRREVLADARRLLPKVNKDGEESRQPNVRFECNSCKELYKATEVAVDHKEPVGATPEWPPITEGDWERWMLRVYCESQNLQVLCKVCHDRKTKGEQQNAKHNRVKSATSKRRLPRKTKKAS